MVFEYTFLQLIFKLFIQTAWGLSKKHMQFFFLFVDFSPTFNTIQHHILEKKLLSNFNLGAGLVKWVLDF